MPFSIIPLRYISWLTKILTVAPNLNRVRQQAQNTSKKMCGHRFPHSSNYLFAQTVTIPYRPIANGSHRKYSTEGNCLLSFHQITTPMVNKIFSAYYPNTCINFNSASIAMISEKILKRDRDYFTAKNNLDCDNIRVP